MTTGPSEGGAPLSGDRLADLSGPSEGGAPVSGDRLAGTLLGTSLGDGLGLVAEGMSAAAIARRFGRVDRFMLLPGRGIVSDDTEQAALVAQSLAREPSDVGRCVRALRRSLAGWFLRLPWGLGLATLRACVRILIGLRESGVRSAGNGASMRAPIVGVFFAHSPERRRSFGEALARVTHTDPQGVEAALFAAEVAAHCALQSPAHATTTATRATLIAAASAIVTEPSLRDAITSAVALAEGGSSPAEAGLALGNTGFVLHTLPLAAFCFVRSGGDPLEAIVDAIAAGGDADTTAAIVGAWAGALHGADALPAPLLARLQGGPFGEAHLRALALDLERRLAGDASPPRARFSPTVAMARNLALFPIVLVQGVRALF